MSSVDLSVIVCTYNRASLLTETLQLLANQTIPSNLQWEIVVVDNNSNDSTAQVVSSFASKSRFPTEYVFEKRQGLNYARNCGIAHSHGAIVVFTDDDITPAREWIRTIIEAMHQHGADGVGGTVLPRWPAPPLPKDRQQ